MKECKDVQKIVNVNDHVVFGSMACDDEVVFCKITVWDSARYPFFADWKMESSSSTTTSDGTGSGLGPFMDNDGLMYQNYRGRLL